MSESKQVIDTQAMAESADDIKVTVQEFIGRNASTMVKLSVFSASLFAFPIVTFFTTLHSLFDGK